MNERYCRIYWAVMDDPKFDGIRENVRHFGSWSMLLLTADMAWPSSAYVPPTIPKASYDALTSAGLVDPLSGGRYRIHGLDAERAERSESARNAAAMRWHNVRNADGNAETMPIKAEQEQEQEQEQGRPRPPTPRQRAHAWLTEHGAAAPTGWVNTTLNELVKVYGADRLCAIWDEAPSGTRTSKQYVQLAERTLAPSGRNGTSPGGHTRSAEEVNDAFR